MLTEHLAELANRLNLLNLQIVAERCAEPELVKVTALVTQLRERIAQCRREMTGELERLSAAKTTCIQWLAAIEPPPTKTSASSAAISSTPSAHPTAATTSLCAPSLPPISEEEFHTVPKYIKGRLTRERINLGVDFFNRTLADKYALLRQNPARLSVEQRQRFYELRDVENDETVGRYFITEQDMKNALAGSKSGSSAFKLDSTGRATLAIMRHLGRIKEMRSSGVIRYLVI